MNTPRYKAYSGPATDVFLMAQALSCLAAALLVISQTSGGRSLHDLKLEHAAVEGYAEMDDFLRERSRHE